MHTIIILVLIALIISLICLWKKPGNRVAGKTVVYFHLFFLAATIISFFLLLNDYKFAGRYTNTVIASSFIISGILVFGLTKNLFLKIYSGFIFLFALVFQLAFLFAPNALMLPYIIAGLVYQPPYHVHELNKNSNIELYEGFMGPPSIIYLSEKRPFLFKKQTLLSLKSGNYFFITKIRSAAIIKDGQIECYFDDRKDPFIRDTLVKDNL